jgi:hypothetical protein
MNLLKEHTLLLGMLQEQEKVLKDMIQLEPTEGAHKLLDAIRNRGEKYKKRAEAIECELIC